MLQRFKILIRFLLASTGLGCNSHPAKVTDVLITEDSVKLSNRALFNDVSVDTTKFYPTNSKDALQPIYIERAGELWRKYVPKSGQADTKQGEFIRIIEKLDNEINGNGKANWDENFVQLGMILKDGLNNSGVFPEDIREEISRDIYLLIDNETAYTDSDVYDRLTRRIVEWSWRTPILEKHIKKSNIYR